MGAPITTHWIDTTWGGPKTVEDIIIRCLVGKASEDIGDANLIYPLSDPVRSDCVTALAVAMDEETGPVGTIAVTRLGGVWSVSFFWTRSDARRMGVASVLLAHAMRHVPVESIQGPFTLEGYRASRAFGRRHGLVPSGPCRLRCPGHGGLTYKEVHEDWSLGRVVPLPELFAEAFEYEMQRPQEPRTDLPNITPSAITRSPGWLHMAQQARDFYAERETAHG